jgi:hypothetical protein
MLKNTATYMLLVVFGAVLTLTSCKKDPFSEKDALVAQKELLAQKFSYDLAIANVNLQIQRVGDSARIAIQNLANSGATALEKERLASSLALTLANFNNQLTSLRYQDSLSRIQDYVNRVGGLRSYQIRVVDFVTKAPISNASVRVLPWGAAAFVSVKTNSDGLATFTNIIADPKAIFYAVDDNTGVTSAITMRYREAIDANPTMEVYRITSSTLTTTVSGSLRGRLDLTNGSSTQNFGAGRSVSLTADLTATATGIASAATTTWSFVGVTGTTGSYSISVPRGYSYTLAVPSTISSMQKMFVNYIEPENQFASVTRVDSTSVIFSPISSVVQTATPLVYGYYFKLPADSVSGKQITIRDGYSAFATTPTFMNGLLNIVSRDIRAADGTSIDTLRTHYSQSISNMVVNNGWEPFGSNYYNYKIRLSADGSSAIQDTLAVEFVNLTGTPYIESMPELVAITNAQGRVISIQTKRETPTSNVTINGGRFKLGTTTSVATVLSTMVNRSHYAPTGNNLITVNATSSTASANVLYAGYYLLGIYTGIK